MNVAGISIGRGGSNGPPSGTGKGGKNGGGRGPIGGNMGGTIGGKKGGKNGGGISGPGIPIGPPKPGNGRRPGRGGPRGTSMLIGSENRPPGKPPGKKRFLRSVVDRFFRPYELDDAAPYEDEPELLLSVG